MNIAHTTTTEKNFVAKEIFDQLSYNKVNGFPFFGFTGLKPSIFSPTELHLKAPRNPGKVDNILVSYDHSTDTYNVAFNGKKGIITRLTDVYVSELAAMIVSQMGVN